MRRRALARPPSRWMPVASAGTIHAHAAAAGSTRSAADGDRIGPWQEENRLGHNCWVCGRTRANERLPGKGRARHLCKECARPPREQRDRVQALIESGRFLHQSNISAGNIARLKRLCGSPSEEVRRKAAPVLEVTRAGRRRAGSRQAAP